MKKNLLKAWAVLVLSLFSLGSINAAERPNIVFFLADDLGYMDCGFSGGKDIKTPHLDKLAHAGAVLESFYVQPVCSPTRAALMTGRYPTRTGLQVGVIRPWAKYGLPLEERTLAQGLKEAGYRTAITGKWHLGSFDKAYHPNARGFDHAYGHLFGAIDYNTHIRDNELDWYRNGEKLKEEGYSTHLLAKEAVKFVNEQSKEKPFFLYFPFNAVHTPLQVPESYLASLSHLSGQRRTMAGMLMALDEAVGQVVAAVEAKGLRKDTLFIFSSDNGGYSPGKVADNGPLRAGKGTLYEGGVRAAAFATWAGQIKPGTRLNTALHMVDWYPTLLKLGGASLAKDKQKLPLDGLDIWPALTKGKPSPHEEILFNSEPRRGAIRVGDWKLVMNSGGAGDGDDEEAPAKNAKKKKNSADEKTTVELFDLAKDLGEKNNLAAQHPDKVKDLQTRLDKYAKEARPPQNAGEASKKQ
ncbi:MAG: arylsulfatase B [Verrucomicrobiota bacterium]